MGQAGPFMRNWRGAGQTGFMFWCPACREGHTVSVTAPPGRPVWRFSGDLERPTFQPSLLIFTTDNEVQPPRRETICHLFVTDGQIQYCADCPHGYAGKTIPMEPIPKHWGGCEETV